VREDEVVAAWAYMVGQVGVHDDHKVTRGEVEAMDVCSFTRHLAIVEVSGDRPEYRCERHSRDQACLRAV